MKSIGVDAEAHIAQDAQTLAMCWKLTRTNGAVLGFTNHHEDMVVSGVTYLAASGMVRSTAVSGASDLSVANTDVETILDSDYIDREDMLAGKYDDAELEIFLVNHQNPTQFQIKLMKGNLGEVDCSKLIAKAELRSLTQRLKQRVGRTHESQCPYNLGDAKCGVNLNAFRDDLVVTEVFNRRRFKAAIVLEDHWYRHGKAKFTSGYNSGLSAQIRGFVNNEVRLHLPMPFDIQVGDAVSLYAGCDKKLTTCGDKFSNENFGGFPHIPGTDWLFSYPSSPTG